MSAALLAAAILLVAIGLAHSLLGERYVLRRLLRRPDLPHLYGSDWFTRRVLRFAWHLTTLTWLGFAAILALAARETGVATARILWVIAATFLLSSIVTAAASRGRHFAWPVFLAIAVLCWLAT